MEGLKMDYSEAAEYWNKKDADAVKMDRAEILEEAEKFINAHNTCALAAGSGEFVRCTPLEYSWRGGKFWIMSEGGEKFRALEKNKKRVPGNIRSLRRLRRAGRHADKRHGRHCGALG
jgi:hypothetical protein